MSALALVKTLHLLAFAGCLLGSATKNVLLTRHPVRPDGMATLLTLDRITGASAGLVLATGLALALGLAGSPSAYAANPVFWIKVALFVAASAAVVSTKPALRRAAREPADWTPPARIRAALLFDVTSLLLIALMGLSVAGRFG